LTDIPTPTAMSAFHETIVSTVEIRFAETNEVAALCTS